MTDSVIGKPIDRVDGRAKVTGTATYAAEVPVANVAHAVIVTSRVAKGAVSAIDIRAAKQAPGVLAVLTSDNAPHLPALNKQNTPQDKILQALQDADIHYADHAGRRRHARARAARRDARRGDVRWRHGGRERPRLARGRGADAKECGAARRARHHAR